MDRSIRNSAPFIDANVKGTQVLLDISRKYGIDKFVHISTDEVYGEIKSGRFSEESPVKPNSPYAASKAAADLLIAAYVRTHFFPAVIVRPCNTYGPWQYPEKLIPLAILKILKNEKVPVYGDGRNIREWLHVSDCVGAVFAVMEKGEPGGIYNAGSGVEKNNIDVVKSILDVLKKPAGMIEFVEDRQGHDIRYSLDSRKTLRETGWRPAVNFDEGLKTTVNWSLKHRDWLLSKWSAVAPLYKRRK